MADAVVCAIAGYTIANDSITATMSNLDDEHLLLLLKKREAMRILETVSFAFINSENLQEVGERANLIPLMRTNSGVQSSGGQQIGTTEEGYA